METENKEKERAFNIIWNASGEYSFKPEIEAYDENGKADIYLNYIIGAVHKYYDYSLLENFFNDLKEDAYQELLKSLTWIGLENCTYERGKVERPVLESLRQSYSKKILSGCDAASTNYLFDEIRIAHFKKALGENPKMTGLASKILNELEFDKSMSTEQIIRRMNKIIRVYFRFGLIPSSYGGKRKIPRRRHIIPFLRLFKIASYKYSGETSFKKKKSRFSKLISNWFKLIELRDKRQREYMQKLYGISILPESQTKAIEQVLCTGNHKNCHMHFTCGQFEDNIINNRDAIYHRDAVIRQREKNKEHYKKDLARNNNSISRLTNEIKNAILASSESYSIRSEFGKFMAERVWRNFYLNDNKIFIKNLKDDIKNLSVDIMLDASSSQANRQEIIASEGYIIAESLTRCRIPVKIYSFFSEKSYTIINLFRDYDETDKNDRIFNYYSTGCNRDGLAIRAALHMMKDSESEHKILIILSDGVPNDTQGIPKNGSSRIRCDYIGTCGVNDTAMEVRKGRQDGVSILCVFTGLDEDIPDARRIYGCDLACIKSPKRFADIVGVLIQNELNNM
jgi:hypothetical protein